MPSTVGSKTSESRTKKPVENDGDAKKDHLKDKQNVKTEEEVAPTTETPPKPKKVTSTLKTKKNEDKEKEKEKRTGSVIMDKVPKKTAQRTKGSISIGKAIEKAESDSLDKKRPPSSSVDRISRPATREEEAAPDIPPQASAPKPKPVRKVKKPEAPKPEEKEEGGKTSARKKKPWVPVLEKKSNETCEEETVEVVETQEETAKSEDNLAVVSQPIASCSFFEKLQQGVKAYFLPRPILKPEVETKKKVTEGGIHLGIPNSGGVTKGHREESKKRKPKVFCPNRKVLKNKLNNTGRDAVRLKSPKGGQMSNFLSTKPKNLRHFRKLKRKKLYRPIRHYVRIEIPRKGYFYRSTIQSEATRTSSHTHIERLEPTVRTKDESKVQISGLVETSAESPDFFKKRVAEKAEKTNLEEEFQDSGISHEGTPKVRFLLDIEPQDGNYGDRRAVYEKPLYGNSQETKSMGDLTGNLFRFAPQPLEYDERNALQKFIETFREKNTDNESEDTRNSFFQRKTPTVAVQSEASFKTLAKCLNSALGVKKFPSSYQNLLEESSNDYRETKRHDCFTEGQKLTEVLDTFDSFGKVSFTLRDKDWLSLDDDKRTFVRHSEDNLVASLMGDIDIHLEFQNYVRGCGGSEHSMRSFGDRIIKRPNFPVKLPRETGDTMEESLKKVPSHGILEDQPEANFFDVVATKSSSSYMSAASTSTLPNDPESSNEVQLHLNKKYLTATVSEELQKCLKPGFTSQTDLKAPEVGKTEQETEQYEVGFSDYVKRTHGKTSFQLPWWEKSEVLLSRRFLHSCLSMDGNKYEKIAALNAKFEEYARKKPKGLIRPSLVRSYSADCCTPNRRNAVQPSRSFDGLGGKTVTERETSLAATEIPETKKHWSPTLQDLIDIYNTVLKENQKNKTNRRNSKITASLFSILDGKLREMKLKSNLFHFTKNLASTDGVDTTKEDTNPVELKEYVSMFQEVLMSSLSIRQIARMNNLMANLHEYSKKNYNFIKNIKTKKEDSLKKELKAPTAKHRPKPLQGPKSRTDRPKSATVRPCLKKPATILNKLVGKDKPVLVAAKKGKEEKPETKASRGKKVDLYGTDIGTLLKSHFSKEKWIRSGSPKDSWGRRSKLMVTVKLKGDRILVSGLCHVAGNKLAKLPSGQKETSQLIIENITGRERKHPTKMVASGQEKKAKCQSEKPQKTNPGRIKKIIIKSKIRKAKPNSTKNVREITETQPPPKVQTSPEVQHSPETQKFEHNVKLVKTQHPLPVIVESSDENIEAKTYELTLEQKKALSEKFPNKLKILEKILKEKLKENIFSKSLTSDFNWNLWEGTGKDLTRTKSYVITRSSEKVETQVSDTERTMDDSLINNSKIVTKARKVLPRNAYLCYPSLQSNECKVKSKTKETKTSKSKTETTKKDTGKKPEKLVKDKTVSSGLSEKPSTNTILFLNKEASPDCSVEFLLTGNISPKCSSCKFPAKTSVNSAPTVDASGNRQVSATAIPRHPESPVVIHSSKSQSDDTSFPSLMIMSESHIKSNSSFALTRSKVQSLLKSNSDMKFYPGRVAEDGEEGNPFVTFVLTPKQKAEAGLPSNQVKVVQKDAVQNETEQEEETQPESEDINDKIPLESIEKFIDVLSKSRLKALRRIRQSNTNKTNKQDMKKSVSSCSKCEAKKKAYQECQKRNQAEKPSKFKVRTMKERTKTGLVEEGSKKKRTERNLVGDGREQKPKDELIFEMGCSGKDEGDRWKPEVLEKDESSRNKKLTPELLHLIKNAIMSSDYKDKQRVASAVEKCSKYMTNDSAGVEKDETSPDTHKLAEVSSLLPSTKTFKIKIHCNGHHQRTAKEEKACQNQPEDFRKTCDLLESLVDNIPRRKSSTYFDASDSLETGGSFPTALTPSDVCLLSGTITEESQGKIFRKIVENLQANNVYYSVLLLEAFLTNPTFDEEKYSRPGTLRDILKEIEHKSIYFMSKLEKTGWRKVLSLLEDITDKFESLDRSANTQTGCQILHLLNALRKQIDANDVFINKVQSLRDKPQNSKNKFGTLGGLYKTHSEIMSKIRLLVNGVKSRIISNWSQTSLSDRHSDSTYLSEETTDKLTDVLKKRLRCQRLRVLYLENPDPEIERIKTKIAERLVRLEEIVSKIEKNYVRLEDVSVKQSDRMENIQKLRNAGSTLKLFANTYGSIINKLHAVTDKR